MKYKLIAVDMDGTLLNDESVLTDRTKAAVAGAVKAGAIFVAASGRPLMGVEFINDLFEEDMPFIIFNGAAAVMGKSRKVLFNEYLDTSLAGEVFELGLEREVPQILWTADGLYASRKCEATEEYQEIYDDMEIKIIGGIAGIGGEKVCKLIWIDKADRVGAYQESMRGHFGERLNCHASRPTFLEFVSPRADKGAAMLEIGRLYGIGRSGIIAVGDGYNDVSMLRRAGLSVAMANAPEDIRAMCDYVALSNNEDGVAAVIDKFILG